MREHVLQWDRTQRKWGASIMASSSSGDYRGPMRWTLTVRRTLGTGKKEKDSGQNGKGKDSTDKRKKRKGDQQKGKDYDDKGEGAGKDQGVGHITKDCWRNRNVRQVALRQCTPRSRLRAAQCRPTKCLSNKLQCVSNQQHHYSEEDCSRWASGLLPT